MARSDSFFIRATVETDSTNFQQTSIDLGSFVDALGKTVMRIHNCSIAFGSPLSGIQTIPVAADASCGWQLTTQSQGSLVGMANRDAAAAIQVLSESLDIAPQDWDGGYLVAVESIFLGVDQITANLFDEVSIVLECTVETMTAAASMALALSQQ